ncbi:LysR family transcriptional regulator (plasmid) [Acidovorax sp. DW039]|uniref:LysR substrate-binding domain-containing protein n=1 Tax=Acidovorax sp. DW039 TaxID=3095606 RepID=UPI003085E3EF|nr:LysR family transcriptional regulator [Acidovorax sp. DW039]
MKLEQLRHLIAIVEHGSLRAASRRLEVAQPALTRSVRSLERELGVDLFARQTSGMVLTAEGVRFHRRACAIANEARRAVEEVQQPGPGYEGTVSIALSIMPHLGMLPEALPVFRRSYPKVKLNITESLLPAVEGSLREGGIDFYLGAAPRLKPAPGLTLLHLCNNTRVVVCRKGHPLAGARSLKELSGAEWAVTSIDHNVEEDLEHLFGAHGLNAPRVMLRAHSALSVQVALARTDLLTMLPRQWVSFAMTQDLLDVVPVCETLPAPAIVLVRRPDLPLSPPSEFFCDVLLRSLPHV